MSYVHLTISERVKIETLADLNYSIREIAHKLGRSPSTVSREMKRCESESPYQAESAQETYAGKKKNCGAKSKRTEETVALIQQKLDETWSPEQITNRLFEGALCFKTIYRWIYEGLLQVPLTVLRQKGKRRKPQETRGRFTIGTPIAKRPKEVRKRETFGHWELDTVVSSRGKSKACVATFIERKTRWYSAIKMTDRTSASMEKAVHTLCQRFPKEGFLTATTDRGKEFSCYSSLQKDLDIQVYFADPYSSWQRGSNENGNGLLREFFPKKTDFATISEDELNEALRLINNRPRKCLKWRTANEALMDEVLHLI